MDNDIEVTTVGVYGEPIDITSPKEGSAPPPWTAASNEEEEEEADSTFSTDDDSTFSSIHERPGNRGRCIVWLGLLLAMAAVTGIIVSVLVPGKNGTNTASSANVADSASAEPTSAPMSPTPAPGVPDECIPFFNNVDYCLEQDLSVQDASACMECVWENLPSGDSNCPQLENSVCSKLNQCECGTCAIYLEEYLACQSKCDFNCQLAVSATSRSGGG